MISATLERAFQLPGVRPLGKPMAFTGAQMQRLMDGGALDPGSSASVLRHIVERVVDFRGRSITWAGGLRLGDLITWSVHMARGSTPGLPAPLTFFKIERFQWIPKVIVRTCPAGPLDLEELAAYHTTCRRGSIECLTITPGHMDGGYLESKHFKRAFNGAFFCDGQRNTTIFCPTLRDLGHDLWGEWRAAARQAV